MVITCIFFGFRGQTGLLIEPAFRFELFCVRSPNLLGTVYRSDWGDNERTRTNLNLAYCFSRSDLDRFAQRNHVVISSLEYRKILYELEIRLNSCIWLAYQAVTSLDSWMQTQDLSQYCVQIRKLVHQLIVCRVFIVGCVVI